MVQDISNRYIIDRVKKYIVAVSGGVDSVVLLDMLVKSAEAELIVAHFDHGIRHDSEKDAFFVRELATKYGLNFETKREELGASASEDLARTRRYNFLNNLAKKYDAKVVTAHHADDVVETIAINLTRKTGWRGLAVMDSETLRPILDMTKTQILDYAKKHKLQWREDVSNNDEKYLRNKIRKKLEGFSKDKQLQLMALRSAQVELKTKIDSEVNKILNNQNKDSRYFFTHIDEPVALEMIRSITKAKLTRPQANRMLHAIKTAKPGKKYQAGAGVEVDFSSRNFSVKMLK